MYNIFVTYIFPFFCCCWRRSRKRWGVTKGCGEKPLRGATVPSGAFSLFWTAPSSGHWYKLRSVLFTYGREKYIILRLVSNIHHRSEVWTLLTLWILVCVKVSMGSGRNSKDPPSAMVSVEELQDVVTWNVSPAVGEMKTGSADDFLKLRVKQKSEQKESSVMMPFPSLQDKRGII